MIGIVARSPIRWLAALTLGVCLVPASLPAWQAADTEQDSATPEAANQPPQKFEYKSIQKLPGAVTLAHLSNGLTVLVQENHVAPVATVRCFVKNTGSAYEGKYLGAGLSHVLEHVVAGGTNTNRAEKEIERIIDTFGGATNAYTTNEMTVYFVDCPAKDVMTCIELVADSMQHIVFEPSEFARELRVVNRELADGEVNRDRVQWNQLKETIYTTSPMRYPTIGYQQVLNETTNQTIIDFYKERYVPNNQIFVVVGDVDTDKVLAQVAKRWEGTPRGYETVITLPEEPEQLSPRESIVEMDGSTYDLSFAWPTVKLSHPDLYALDLAAYILTEGDSSRLHRKLVKEQPLCLEVDSASLTPHFVKGFFGIFATATPERWQPASQRILAEVYRLRDDLVSEEELDRAKKQKAAEQVFGRQTVQQAAESLGRSYISADDPLFDDKYVANIQKVTPEQIREVARKYFVPHRLNKVIIAPPGGAPRQTLDNVVSDEGPIQKHVLDNGLTVLVKRVGHLPMVNIQAYTMGATLVEEESQAGLSSLLAAMLDQGTMQHSSEEIALYFDRIGGKISMAGGRNTIYGSATVLKDDFTEAASLFAECFTRPTFPQTAFENLKQRMLGAISQRAGNPQSEIFDLFYENLPESTPYHILQSGTQESVTALTADDLRKFHKKWFVPNNMVVAVFGDVNPDEALKLVKQQFGNLPSDPNFKPIDVKRSNALAETIVKHKQTVKPTGMVVMGYPMVSIFDEKDFAALTLLDAIMSGYSYPGGWLHNELRGEGLVYYVHAFNITGPAPGYFTIMSQTRPDAVGEVVRRIHANVERAKAGQIEEDEFNNAKLMVTALHAQSNTSISEQAQQACLDELYGLGFKHEKGFDDRINAVTRDDVLRVARKYLQNHVLVTSSPEASTTGAPSESETSR